MRVGGGGGGMVRARDRDDVPRFQGPEGTGGPLPENPIPLN